MVYSKLLPADNIVDNDLGIIADALETLGFRIELAELPWKQTPPTPFLCPAYSQPRPAGDNFLQPLEAINIVVADIAAARSLITALFDDCEAGPVLAHEDYQGFSITIGEAVLCFYQPARQEHVLGQFLAKLGPGVHSLVYRATAIKEIELAAKAAGLTVDSQPSIGNWQMANGR